MQPALAPALHAMVECGLVFDALVKPVHLPHILTLAQRYPDLRMVIDHAAKPDIAAGEWQPWADDMLRVAGETQAYCKLSGLMTEAGPKPAAGAVTRWGKRVLKSFGARRVVWGSDWPVLELAGSYGQWWRETQHLLAGLGVQERAAIMGDNAKRLYRL